MSFNELGLSPHILRAVKGLGYEQPTPIQQQAIPAILAGQDVLGGAQTGTGKTAGFTLPMLHRLLANHGRGGRRQVRALVLTPTRELAAQVGESIIKYAHHLPFRTLIAYGGVSIKPNLDAIKLGVDILVATPGRLLDLLTQRALTLSALEVLVLDEADRMLDMGFITDIRRIMKALPEERQTLLFSATFSDDIKALADDLLKNPTLIEVSPSNSTAEQVNQRIIKVDRERKRELLSHMIGRNNWQRVLVFVRTKQIADRLAEQMVKDGLDTVAIHGDKTQGARNRALADFREGKVRVLVATDIAARGLDIDQLPHVVNFELPNVEEDYVHRIGRTGRAGRSGEAISLVAPDEEKLLKSIERVTRQKIPDGDLMGFDASQVEAEKPEVRERPQNNGRGGRNQQARGEGGKDANGGRKDKGKDKGKAKHQAADKPADKDKAGDKPQQRKPRDKKPRQQQQASASVPKVPADRDPEEFLDDEIDNFGNRADYVSPYQNGKGQGRNRRPGGNASQGNGQRSNSGGQGRTGGQQRSGSGGSEKRPPRANNGGGARRDGGAGRGRPTRDDAARQEPAVRNPRQPEKQPVIIRKESKLDRYPTPEQLDDLPSRPRGERPALLTRKG